MSGSIGSQCGEQVAVHLHPVEPVVHGALHRTFSIDIPAAKGQVNHNNSELMKAPPQSSKLHISISTYAVMAQLMRPVCLANS
jgi:hypothetical protein